jgi:hypothetical protein
MLPRKNFAIVAAVSLLCALGSLRNQWAADAPKAAGDDALVIIDNAGKEQKLKKWSFVVGTRRLSWLAPAAPAKEKDKEKGKDAKEDDKPKPADGPEALVFREDNSTNFIDGILTFVPLDHIRAIEFDNDKESATVRVFTGEKADEDEVLTGTTKFEDSNKITIEAEVDLGDLGLAEKKFLGGVPKGIRGIRFPAPAERKAAPASAGRPAQITATDKEKTVHKVTDLQPLYKVPGGERLLPTLMFKKTLKLDVAKVQKLEFSKGTRTDVECQVTLKDGAEHTLTLLRSIPFDGQTATLEGLVGRVTAGYKLFPLHTIAEVQFDEAKGEPKDKPKDEDKP